MVLAAFPSLVVVVVHSTAAAGEAYHPIPTDSDSGTLQQKYDTSDEVDNCAK